MTFQFCWHFSFGEVSVFSNISVLATFQFLWYFTFDYIQVLVTFNFVDTSVSDRSRICPRYVQNMYHICPKYISDMSQIGPRYVPNMFKTCPRYVPEYLIVCPSLEKVWISWTSPNPQRDDGRRPTHNPNIELSIYVQSMAGLGRIGRSGVQQLLSTLLCVCYPPKKTW